VIKILFVDDEQSVLSAIERALFRDRTRWTMVFACGAEAALAEIARKPYDIIVSDFAMPGMDGIELLKRARATFPRVIGIILTGNVERLNEERMRDSVNEVLRKPQPIPALRACLERWESGPRSRG
jgi:CheY-like chemotaxis protein